MKGELSASDLGEMVCIGIGESTNPPIVLKSARLAGFNA